MLTERVRVMELHHAPRSHHGPLSGPGPQLGGRADAIAVYSLVGLAPTMFARMPTLSFAPVKAMVTSLATR